MTTYRVRRPQSAKPSILRNPSIGKAAAALAAYEGAKQLWSSAQSAYKDHLLYTVTVDETDHVYGDVHEWLTGALSPDKQRSLVATTSKIRHYEDDEGDRKPADVKLTFNDRRPKTFRLGRHLVMARVARLEDGGDPANRKLSPMCIVFATFTKEAQGAVIAKIEEIQASKGARQPVLRIPDQWGHWTRRSDLPLRDLESVVLPPEQKGALVADLGRFLDAEDRYVKLALPWHRGYLLHGRPGTGKTSMVKALANEFKLDLWYISLGDLKEESSLMNLLSEVAPRSILLLEDVDTVQLTHDRSEAPKGKQGPATHISLSSLLNALDGVATPHGLITIMTTNHFDRLDPALTRAGRMDRVEELAFPRAAEANELYRRFYGRPGPLGDEGAELGISQAAVSEIFKRHLDDPDGAASALAEAVAAWQS